MDNWKQNLIDSITKDDQITFIKFCTLLDQDSKQIEQQLIESIGTKSAYSSTTIQCLQKQFQQQQPKQQKPRASKNVIKNILLKSESKNNILPKQEKYLNNFLYSDSRKLKTLSLNNNIEKNYLTILDKTLNGDQWKIDENLFESILINSYHTQSSELFWRYANECIYKKIDLKLDIHNLCWKFLFLCHWLIRNGHPNVIKDAYAQRPLLVELAKIKTCINSSQCCLFGILNPLYFSLVLQKIEFHMEHMKIPGNLVINNIQFEQIGDNDPDLFEQIAIELFNYMDKILQLQTEIFDIRGLNIGGWQQKCILNPLKLSLIESSQIYDLIFQLMHKLHQHSSYVSENDLKKYRHRFINQFQQLKLFYLNCKQYEYLSDSIQIPELIDEPPSFFVVEHSEELEQTVFYPRIVIE